MARYNSNSADDFFAGLGDYVELLREGRGRVIPAPVLFKMADYVQQIFLLRSAALPLTKGCAKVHDTFALPDKPLCFEPLLTELERRRDAEPVSAQRHDRETGEAYTSISPWWWAMVKITAAITLAAE